MKFAIYFMLLSFSITHKDLWNNKNERYLKITDVIIRNHILSPSGSIDDHKKDTVVYPLLRYHVKDDIGNLVVNIIDLHSNRGQVFVSIFNGKDGFPGNTQDAVQIKTSTIRNNVATVTFNNLRYGEYAVSLFHDENTNNTLDTNWLGIPKEGAGISNNTESYFKNPSFEKAKFEIKSKSKLISVTPKYP